MRKHLGRISFGLAVGGWLLLLGALWAGGIDPSPEDYNTLRSMMAFVLGAETLAIPLGFVGMIIGPHRVASFLAMLLAGAYFLYFTGMLLMFYTAG